LKVTKLYRNWTLKFLKEDNIVLKTIEDIFLQ